VQFILILSLESICYPSEIKMIVAYLRRGVKCCYDESTSVNCGNYFSWSIFQDTR
jgi:hypothetical protein